MNAEKRARLAELQDRERHGNLGNEAKLELYELRRALAVEQQEKPDDPNTWLVDESSRPNLDGSNYNDTLRAMTCDEFERIAAKALAVLGRAAFDAVVAKVTSG